MRKSSTPKVFARKARAAHRKVTPKVPAKKARAMHHKTTPKVAAEKASNIHRKNAPKLSAERASHTHHKNAAQLDEFRVEFPRSIRTLAKSSVVQQREEVRADKVPDSMRALAERNVIQTRELCGRSTKSLQAAFESWVDSWDAAGQGAVALNRKIINIAERNIDTVFDLAMSLARAKNLAETMEVQAIYWRKQFDELRMQAVEVRVLLDKVAVCVAEPIKAQMTRDIDETMRRFRSIHPYQEK